GNHEQGVRSRLREHVTRDLRTGFMRPPRTLAMLERDANEVRAPGTRFHAVRDARREPRPLERAKTLELAQRGTHEHFEHARHRGRLAGEPEEQLPSRSAESLRAARLHGHEPARDSRKSGERLFHRIVMTRGDAAEG